jgi:threonine/homoserine/homoserine lactone efflux protein
MWRDKGALSVEAASQPSSGRRLIVRAFLLNILNPKLSLFFLAFLPQFLVPDASSPFVQLLSLSTVFMGMTFLVFVLYGLLANVFRQAVIDAPRVQGWMRRGFSAAFAILGLNLVLAER